MGETNVRQKVFSITEANSFFILLALLFLTVGAYVQNRELISGLLITEFGLMAAPVLLYALFTKKNMKAVFRFNRIPFSAIIKVMILAALLLPTVAVANLVTIFIIELLGEPIISMIPTASNGAEFALLFAVIAGSAGICEEIFFRGAILNAYESKLGRKWGAVFSGLLFGIFHFNPQNLFGPIILGIMFSYLVQLTGSIFTSMIAHVTNNGIAVAMGYFTNITSKSGILPQESNDLIFSTPGVILGVMVFYMILGIICIIGIKAVIKSLKTQFPRNEAIPEAKDKLSEVDVTSMASDEQIDSIWDNRPLKISMTELLPIGLAIMIYGLVIYVAYF
ncbi:CPBP family glutamic-type intramembrane protease [Fusibacter bizertensis]